MWFIALSGYLAEYNSTVESFNLFANLMKLFNTLNGNFQLWANKFVMKRTLKHHFKSAYIHYTISA